MLWLLTHLCDSMNVSDTNKLCPHVRTENSQQQLTNVLNGNVDVHKLTT